MKLSEDQTLPEPSTAAVSRRGVFGIMGNQAGMTLEGKAIPLSTFIGLLESQVGRRVEDKTELSGLFDIELRFTPEMNGPQVTSPPSSDLTGPSIFTAIQEQLGLKLESAKGPVEVIVIDSVERPSEN
jgi:uncharacterized protein (TIGR03435 family)